MRGKHREKIALGRERKEKYQASKFLCGDALVLVWAKPRSIGGTSTARGSSQDKETFDTLPWGKPPW